MNKTCTTGKTRLLRQDIWPEEPCLIISAPTFHWLGKKWKIWSTNNETSIKKDHPCHSDLVLLIQSYFCFIKDIHHTHDFMSNLEKQFCHNVPIFWGGNTLTNVRFRFKKNQCKRQVCHLGRDVRLVQSPGIESKPILEYNRFQEFNRSQTLEYKR